MLKSGKWDSDTLLKKNFIQVPKRLNYKQVKERVLDCVNNSTKQQLELDDIRLWKTEIDLDKIATLIERVKTNFIHGAPSDDDKMHVDQQYSASNDEAPGLLDHNES